MTGPDLDADCPAKCGRIVADHTMREFTDCLSGMAEYAHPPYEDVPGEPLYDTIPMNRVAGAVTIKSLVSTTSLGVFPVLRFEWRGAPVPIDPTHLLADDETLRKFRTLVWNSVDGAIKAAQGVRKKLKEGDDS